MGQKFDSIIFDMDGTLWDAVDSYCAVWDATFAALGINGTVTRQSLIKCMGMTIDRIFDRVAAHLCPPEKRAEYLRLLDENEERMMAHLGGILYPGVRDGLEQLSGRYRLFMVSNCGARGLENFLDFTHLRPYFTDTLTYGETLHGKDYNIALISQRNALTAPIYVGDTAGDCKAAHAADIPMMHVTYGFGEAPDADFSASSFPELVKFFIS